MNISKNLQYTHTQKTGMYFCRDSGMLRHTDLAWPTRSSGSPPDCWQADTHTTNRGARLAPGGIINSLVKFKTVKQWCLHTPARTHAHTMQRVNFIRLASIVKIFQDDWMARLLITHIKLFCLRRTVK